MSVKRKPARTASMHHPDYRCSSHAFVVCHPAVPRGLAASTRLILMVRPVFCCAVYVGNLPWATSTDDLRQLFGQFGQVVSVLPEQTRVLCADQPLPAAGAHPASVLPL